MSATDTEAIRQHAQQDLVVYRVERCNEIQQYKLTHTAVIDCTDQIVVDDEYGSLSRVNRSVGGLLGWQQNVLIDVDREAFDNETFDEFGNERRLMGDGRVEAGDLWIQCGFLRSGVT